MIIVILTVLGLCFGSFVNAVVWRLHEQAKQGKRQKAKGKRKHDQFTSRHLSILKGRSMCPNCQHSLGAQDLVPVLSWLSLGGKCRYCHKPISGQYPLVELATAVLFIISYAYWPWAFNNEGSTLFIIWLTFVVGLTALAVYDLKWMLLPNRLVYPLLWLAVIQVLIRVVVFQEGLDVLLGSVWGFLIGGGIFYALFQVSAGKWIGGGDVKLGALLGLIVGGPSGALLMIFTASFIGTLVSLPLLATKRLKTTSRLPFGPFLIAAMVIVYIFGASIISWYKRQFLIY